jgi:hypothetical protein
VLVIGTLDDLQAVAAVIQVLAVVAAGSWAAFKVREYRERKNLIQLDLDAHVYPLSTPITVAPVTWKKDEDDRATLEPRTHEYAIEVLLRFQNKGRTRFRLFNVQVGVSTLRSPDETRFDRYDGHLHLTRVVTSGNIVPPFEVSGKPLEETAFYYVEPGVEQTIHYLTLIPKPRELLQVVAEFSLAQRRIFPKERRLPGGPYPHSAVRTFGIGASGELIGRN